MTFRNQLPTPQALQAQMRVHLPQGQPHALLLQLQQQRQQQQHLLQLHQHPQTHSQYNQYSQALTNDKIFLFSRSPFFETVSRHCVLPIHQRQVIQFQFNLPSNYVKDIKSTLKTKDSIVGKELHIRLFDMNLKKHEPWDVKFWELLINGCVVDINTILKVKPITNNKKKRMKGFSYVQPLDISVYAQSVMQFQIVCKRNQFTGAAAIEIENRISVLTISDRICRRSELALNAHILEQQTIDEKQSKEGQEPGSTLTPHPTIKHKCKVCNKIENLSRCSRCKSIWYCSREHQANDWSIHHHICMTFDKLKVLHFLSDTKDIKAMANNSDVICSESRISLKDPLSLCRIKIPVRGVNCLHPQCMDLETFLNFSKHCKLWQCPTCMKSLQSEMLLVDYDMKQILQETDENIDLVRLFPDQNYRIITLEELEKEEEQRMNSIGKKRKGKNVEGGIVEKRRKVMVNGVKKQKVVSKVINDLGGTSSSSVSVSVGNTMNTAIVLD